METPLSAAAVLTAHLDSLVQVATLLAGDQRAGEILLSQTVHHLLPRWKDIGPDPCRQIRCALAGRLGHHLPHLGHAATAPATAPDPADPVRTALADLPGHCRAVVVMSLLTDDTEAELAAGLRVSLADVRHQLDRGLARIRDRVPGLPDGSGGAAVVAERLRRAVTGIRSTPELRAEMLATAVRLDPDRPVLQTPDRKPSRMPNRRTLTKIVIGVAAVTLVASIPVARALIGPSETTGSAHPPAGSSPAIVLSPEWRADPVVDTPPLVTADLCRTQMLDPGGRQPEASSVIGLCWPIETGEGTVWAAGRVAVAGSAGGATLTAMGDPRYYADSTCRSTVQLRPVLLRAAPRATAAGTGGVDPGPAVSLGCLPADDPEVGRILRNAAAGSSWTISEPTARCDPRVSDGLVYQPYRLIAAESWDLGVICVDSPADGRATSFAVLSGDRLASARTVVDRWLKGNGIAFCTGGTTTRPRVALWLAKNDGLGRFQGVFGPSACAMGPEVISAFRMLANPANRLLATPDLTGLDLTQMVAALARSGFAET